tara:strand:- start:477 stop:1316 length:840 start_codon:yes stop_codon:yes gene_type:complete
MATKISFDKKLGIGTNSIDLPVDSIFDVTSWALGGQDDYLRNNNTFDTLVADDSSVSPSGAKWSISLWLKVPEVEAGVSKIIYFISNGANENQEITRLRYIGNGQLRARIKGYANNWTYSAAGAITPNVWHHITVVYDSTINRYSRLKIYHNASTAGNLSNFYRAIHGESTSLFLGVTNEMGSPAGFYEGNINEFAMWYGTALDQDEVSRIYNSGGPAKDLENTVDLPVPTHYFRSENAIWNPSDPADEHYTVIDNMGTGKTIRTKNMPQSSIVDEVPT